MENNNREVSLMRGTLGELLAIAGQLERKIHVVGGFIRDALLGVASRDVDMTVDRDALQFAKKVCWLLDGEYELLDSRAELSRVTVMADDGKRLCLDFSLARGRTMEDDLCCRDFTVNAMAVPLERYLAAESWPEHLIDPAGGRRDLEQRILRLVSEDCLRDDPVRLVRAPRFMQKLGLALEEKSAVLIRRNAPLVSEATNVKLSLELFLLLNTPEAAEGLHLLWSLGVLGEIYPPFADMSAACSEEGDLLAHGLATLRRLEIILSGGSGLDHTLLPLIKLHLAEEVADRRSRLACLKLACLLHDSGKLQAAGGKRKHFSHEQAGVAYAAGLARRLKLGQKETGLLTALVQNHSRPVYLAGRHLQAPRSRFFVQFGEMAPDLLLLALANRGGKPADLPALAEKLLAEYFSGRAASLPKPVVTAGEVMEFFGLPPTRALGALLEEVYEAQMEGKVADKGEALSLISVLLAKR
jgi:tRNA nucleotidyltransferase/poly(A) polymerase